MQFIVYFIRLYELFVLKAQEKFADMSGAQKTVREIYKQAEVVVFPFLKLKM